VVDDDPGLLRALSRILGKPFQVTSAGDGARALEVAQAERPDLAIVDIRLPDMTGFEVTRGIKGKVSDVDVILMTGNSEDPDESLIRAIDEGAFYFIQKPFDRRVLLALVGRCLELRGLRLERERYLKRVARELEEARRFQRSLLPAGRLESAGLQVEARYLACSELAGDFYDYVELRDGSVGVLIADVVGHGASAAMMTSLVKASFRAAMEKNPDPGAVVKGIGEGLRDFEAGHFVTLCYGLITQERDEFWYANAGHPAAILRRGSGGHELLEATGPIVSSAFLDRAHEPERKQLEAGDCILMYTDGLTESPGPGGLFGEGRLIASVLEGNRQGHALLEGILAEREAFAGTRTIRDDITLVVLSVG
jgi:sigma-B regulation protein RsbU (phosphoserine phosphatase)